MAVTVSEPLNTVYLMTPGVPFPVHDIDAILTRPNWQARAACGDQPPNVFFPERGQPTRPAVAICRTYAVRPECLEFAMADSSLTGIWGGTSERQRRQMRRQARQGTG